MPRYCLTMVQTAPVEWERPSERVRELIRQGAELVLNAQSEWLEELDEATLSAANAQELAKDPALNAATRRSTRSNVLHWAAANVSDPGAPVSANLGPEPLGIARDLVRRGLSESALQVYRVGQNVAWRRWMSSRLRTDVGSRRAARTARRIGAVAVRVRRRHARRHRRTDSDRARRADPGNARGATRSRRADPRRSADQQAASRGAARIQTRTDPHRGRCLERRNAIRFEPIGARDRSIDADRRRSRPTQRDRRGGHPLGLDSRQGRPRRPPSSAVAGPDARGPHRCRIDARAVSRGSAVAISMRSLHSAC